MRIAQKLAPSLPQPATSYEAIESIWEQMYRDQHFAITRGQLAAQRYQVLHEPEWGDGEITARSMLEVLPVSSRHDSMKRGTKTMNPTSEGRNKARFLRAII